MGRNIFWAIIGLILISFVMIGFQSAFDPTEITGDWYAADTGVRYHFQDGVITCEECSIDIADGTSYCGAYYSAKGKVLLFYSGADGLGGVRELYLHRNRGGDFLSDTPNGSGTVYFRRNP